MAKSALFICKGNWFRSQVAAAIYNDRCGARLAHSAGTYAGSIEEPEGMRLVDLFETDALFVVMESHGLYVRDAITRGLTERMLDQYDLIISMAEPPFIPPFLERREDVVRWPIPNPNAMSVQIARDMYDRLVPLVERLLIE